MVERPALAQWPALYDGRLTRHLDQDAPDDRIIQVLGDFIFMTLTMYAWVGEDELGSGVVGLKQGVTPAGMIPLAAMGHHLDRLATLVPQMELAATMYGKRRYLIRFEAVAVAAETEAGEANETFSYLKK